MKRAASAEGSAASPLDASILEGLRLYGGREVLVSTIDSFLENTPVRLRSLGDAVGRGDLEEVAHLAHNLRGTCGTVGALGIVRACARLEEEARAGRSEALADALGDLDGRWPAVVAALQAERDRT